MTGSERKRAWRLAHPEQSARAECERALARRRGFWSDRELGTELRLCASHDSYWRYENTMKRMKQRMFWPRYGAGTTTLTRAQFRARTKVVFADARRAAFARIDAL